MTHTAKWQVAGSMLVLLMMAGIAASSPSVSARDGYAVSEDVPTTPTGLLPSIIQHVAALPRLTGVATLPDELAAVLQRRVRIHFADGSGQVLASETFRVRAHPDWVMLENKFGRVQPVIDGGRIARFLSTNRPASLPAPHDCVVRTSSADSQGIERARIEQIDVPGPCVPKPGYVYDTAVMAPLIASSLSKDITAAPATVPVRQAEGMVIDATQSPPARMTLLGSGRSDFAGSGLGRKGNVRKAINERVNGVIIRPGAQLSFVKLLDPPVDTGKGWFMALAIFNNGDLREVPGGGICQSSTTTYRAVLQAGLPVLVRRSHSLYVHYYEKYGVGQDATVYPGSQDFVFQNDMPSPILLEAHTVGDEAFVDIYGVPDGRTVALKGPYFARNAPSELRDGKGAVQVNQIVWLRTVISKEGASHRDVFVSQYKALPRTLADEWISRPVTLQSPVTADVGSLR